VTRKVPLRGANGFWETDQVGMVLLFASERDLIEDATTSSLRTDRCTWHSLGRPKAGINTQGISTVSVNNVLRVVTKEQA
jgi:hypothetical protein